MKYGEPCDTCKLCEGDKMDLITTDLNAVDFSRAGAVEMAELVLAVALKDGPEAIVNADILERALGNVKAKIRKLQLEEMIRDGCDRDVYNGQYRISMVKLPVKYEYPNPELTAINAKIAELTAYKKDLEKAMQKNGQAVAQTEQGYTIKLTENKLTIKDRRADAKD